jgi:NAD(P)-dependent dehydrogenase (short-subunit alcohol dehydrogenase family)
MTQLPESNLKLHDRTALIFTNPGATVHVIATKLTQLGVNVAIVESKTKLGEKPSEQLVRLTEQLSDAREINDAFGRALLLSAVPAQKTSLQEAVGRVAESFGGIDILVDASLFTENRAFADPKTPDMIEATITSNLEAPIAMTHAALKFLEGKKRGRVIFLLPDLFRAGFQGHSLASAARGGLVAFSRTLARELMASQVTVNCIAHGPTEEFLLGHAAKGTNIQMAQKTLNTDWPQAVLMDAEKLANSIAYLASPLSSGMTGQTIVVSQGLTMST